MEEGGAESAAGEAQADAASPGRGCLVFGSRNGGVGIGVHRGGGMLTAATEADEHLDDAGELVLRAGGVGGGEVPGDAEDVDGGREAWPRAAAHSIAEPWAMEKK